MLVLKLIYMYVSKRGPVEFIHILHGYANGTGEMLRLGWFRWGDPVGYDKVDRRTLLGTLRAYFMVLTASYYTVPVCRYIFQKSGGGEYCFSHTYWQGAAIILLAKTALDNGQFIGISPEH